MDFLICSIIKNEHLYLREWIEHHLSIGFTDIYLFEDYGSISHIDIVRDYPNVHLTKLDNYFKIKRDYDRGDKRQQRLYQKFLNENHSGWCAFIDLDEYIYLSDGMSLESICSDCSDYTGISIYWKMFGANGNIRRPIGDIRDNYVNPCGFLVQDKGWCFKSFVNLDVADEWRYLHDIVGLRDINGNKVKAGDCSPIYDKIWINHYYTKSFEDWICRFKRGDLMPNHRKFGGFFELNKEFDDRKVQFTDMYLSGVTDISEYEKVVPYEEEKEIPKKIYYCWFGGSQLPDYAKLSIESWKKYMPGYEIIQIDESNFDVNKYQYTKIAYENGQYAFVSDMARVYMIYNNGGIYMDTDVEMIRPIDDLVSKGSFMGFEKPIKEGRDMSVASGLILCGCKHNKLIGDVLYDFMINDEPHVDNCLFFTDRLKKQGLLNEDIIQVFDNMTVYPTDYFCPLSFSREMTITENTRAIHWYTGNWSNDDNKI